MESEDPGLVCLCVCVVIVAVHKDVGGCGFPQSICAGHGEDRSGYSRSSRSSCSQPPVNVLSTVTWQDSL